MLVLEVEFLTGAYRGARGPGLSEPDWPPQPDRVFSALVATWAARGERDDERAALEWLEAQDAPQIHASAAAPRTAHMVFVPVNDVASAPDHRKRRPRMFAVARPESPVMNFVWRAEPDAATHAALDALARDVASVGTSASLTRCRFGGPVPTTTPQPPTRRLYPGRLTELRRAHAANPVRPRIPPAPGALPAQAVPQTPRQGDWLVLAATGPVPDIRATATLCQRLRLTLMAGYGKAEIGDAPPMLHGHEPDGRPWRGERIAIVPMAFVGHQHADGRLMGLALIPPRSTALLDVPGLREAWEAVAPWDAALERRVLALSGDSLAQPVMLAPRGPDAPRSLDPAPYLAPVQVWASVTPVVLDRHPKGGMSEASLIVADACERAGLPRPDPERITVSRHASVTGAPSVVTDGHAWTRWRRPAALASRPHVHVRIDFGTPVAGPVLLGAGRFTGLGLCRGVAP
jgi:CRISPR-associated protein Csb2